MNEQLIIKLGRPKKYTTIEELKEQKRISNNRDIEKQRRKEYSKKHYEEKSHKVECECGGHFTSLNFRYHINTKKHTDFNDKKFIQ